MSLVGTKVNKFPSVCVDSLFRFITHRCYIEIQYSPLVQERQAEDTRRKHLVGKRHFGTDEKCTNRKMEGLQHCNRLSIHFSLDCRRGRKKRTEQIGNRR